MVLGFHPDAIGIELASDLVARGKSVKECVQIVHPIPHFLSPSTGEQRANCIHKYAALKHDPSACELLMPSSYGLSCVGAAMTARDSCSMRNGQVTWNGGNTTYASCRFHDPQRSLEGNQCCLIARVAFVKSENDCSALLDFPSMHDECLQSLAFKNHAPEICEGIANDNRKIACFVNARAIQKNPNICDGCKERVEHIEDLQ